MPGQHREGKHTAKGQKAAKAQPRMKKTDATLPGSISTPDAGVYRSNPSAVKRLIEVFSKKKS